MYEQLRTLPTQGSRWKSTDLCYSYKWNETKWSKNIFGQDVTRWLFGHAIAVTVWLPNQNLYASPGRVDGSQIIEI